jgi:hypothetical protein
MKMKVIDLLFSVLFIVQLCHLCVAPPPIKKLSNSPSVKFEKAPKTMNHSEKASFHAKQAIKHDQKANGGGGITGKIKGLFRSNSNKQAHADLAAQHRSKANRSANKVPSIQLAN